ncbi:hypothetical protein CCACVL1_21668 [Corchorus capsularis]|uniref:Uncharacterized protein n=1 Tax=Corchorus capsularis TaxID=210143 RepID=A0A1R3H2I6_COCAP|nr:hypothetical protein CCACVL1_21668 [Corchorus capsularis]
MAYKARAHTVADNLAASLQRLKFTMAYI